MGLVTRRDLGPRPTERLVLYDFEACPYCRKVREALSELDLEVLVRPCPKGGQRFRPEAVARGGRAQFPYLVDPGAGAALYESEDIVRHLFARYGSGAVPLAFRVRPLPLLVSAFRPTRGLRAVPSRAPEQPLELYSFEASPYCRLVRERLCELELPYVLHNVAKRSPSRPDFVALSGRMMVPFLVDPNTGSRMFESADILGYLDARYGRAAMRSGGLAP
ncbi:MAG: glutathione S-transferase N-terminal domain-containing protein [Sandaracinaceae bacterium]|nr:glutathione S-transferase N-terminal domain-containing protein [Sandaracinaceae bacterium]